MANSTLAAAQVVSLTKAEERALELLGYGAIPEQAAIGSGLSASRISQLLSQEEFAAAVAERRFQNLSKHNARDNAYDDLEDTLLEKMRDCVPLMVRPHEILKAIQVINAAKRRGSSAPTNLTEQQTVINLTIPTQILNQFALSPQNQVVSIQGPGGAEQSLLTIQSGSLLKQVKEKKNVQSELAEISRSRALTASDF